MNYEIFKSVDCRYFAVIKKPILCNFRENPVEYVKNKHQIL